MRRRFSAVLALCICFLYNFNMAAVKLFTKLFTNTRVYILNFKIQRRFLIREYVLTPRNIKSFVTSTSQSGKYNIQWRKIHFCLGVCIGCASSFKLFDWLDHMGFQKTCYNSIAYAKTGVSKSKQFNFVADVVEIIAPAVVHIEGRNCQDRFMGHMMSSSSSGSGFLVSEDGLVLTNAHVVQNMRSVTVTLSDGSSIVGDIVRLDRASDLASVQLRNPSKRKFEIIKLGDSSEIRPGEFVVAIGSPLRLSNTVTSGIVSTVHRAAGDLSRHLPHVEYIQTDAAINVGNSGGPLVNLDGEVIGVNSMTVKDAVGISFAIPVNIVKEFLQTAVQKKPSKPVRGFIGIHMLTLTPGIIDALLSRVPGFPSVKSGVFIPEVVYNSPSYRAGIYPGDVILSINGTKVTNSQEVYDFVAKGELLTIEILRGPRKLKVDVQPESVQ